jgi:hypothetical protein
LFLTTGSISVDVDSACVAPISRYFIHIYV